MISFISYPRILVSSMSDKRHYHSVNPLKLTRVPRVFVSLCVTGKPQYEVTTETTHYERVLRDYSIGEYVRSIVSYSNRGEQTEYNPKWGYHGREYLRSITEKHKSIYLLCNGVQRCFTLLGLWELFDEGMITLPGIRNRFGTPIQDKFTMRGYVAIGGNTEIIVCKWGDCTIRAVSHSNYGNVSLDDIMQGYGEEYDAINIRQGEDSEAYPDVLDIQRSMADWYRKMLMQWKSLDSGTWKTTSSQLSHTLYRRKFLKERLTTIRPPQIDRLERASLFGGRADVFYIGDVSTWHRNESLRIRGYKESEYNKTVESIYRLDISSMYPFIFSQYEVPGHCVYHETGNAFAELKFAIESDYIIIAAVRINTPHPEYPVRIHPHTKEFSVIEQKRFFTARSIIPGSVEYGVGEFDTVLIGPELERAYHDNLITKCYEYAVYLPSSEYMDYMQYLINMRYACRLSRDARGEAMYKMYGNSFGGKLAQKNCGWNDAPENTPVLCQWGEWYALNCDDQTCRKYRAIAGYPQVWKDETYNALGRPAVWSYVCAVSRYIMRSIREILPRHTLIQQDTDGLYVTNEAIGILTVNGMLSDDGPGKLRIVSQHKHVRFYDARHYIRDGQAVMSGLSAGFSATDGGSYLDTKEYSIGHGKLIEAPSSVKTSVRYVVLNCEVTPSRIDGDGYVLPYRVSNQSAWQPYNLDPLATLFRGLHLQ